MTEIPERPLADGYRLRPAEISDLRSVMSLLRPFVDKRLILRRTRAEVQSLLATGFVTLDGEDLVGFASVEVYSKKLAEIQCLAVNETHQGKGLGAALVAACVALAKKLGVMEVMAISSSDRFLINQGFDYALPNQKKALFLQLRSRDEVYQEIEEHGED